MLSDPQRVVIFDSLLFPEVFGLRPPTQGLSIFASQGRSTHQYRKNPPEERSDTSGVRASPHTQSHSVAHLSFLLAILQHATAWLT